MVTKGGIVPMTKGEKKHRTIKPALTPEGRENQLVSLAVGLAEKQMLEGTASAQVITHYLKLGSTKEKLEYEFKRKQMELIEAKTEALQSAKNVEILYKDALDAMRHYGGYAVDDSRENEKHSNDE